jgi:hypothetical protein
MRRDSVLNLRVPSEIKAALLRAAEDDHGRSASGMAVRVFREWLTERGYLKAEPKVPPTRRKKG